MKKILIVLFSLLLLVGCGPKKEYSHVTDSDTIIFKGENTEFTKDSLYKILKITSLEAIETDLLNKIADKLNVNKEEIAKEADDMIDLYDQMGYKSSLIAYYGSIENYKQMYISSGVLTKLTEMYIDENYDQLVSEDLPIKMQIVNFATEEKANLFIEDINKGKTFDTAASNNGYTSSVAAKVYLDSDTTIPFDVKKYINDTDIVGLSKIIPVTTSSSDASGNVTSNTKYYIINIISRSPEKQEYVDAKIQNVKADDVKEYMFKKYKVEFYDQDIYEMMAAAHEVFK